MQNVTGGRDRVGTQEQFFVAQLGARHQPPGQCGIARQVSIRSRREICFFDAVATDKRVCCLAIVTAGLECVGVGGDDVRFAAEFGFR